MRKRQQSKLDEQRWAMGRMRAAMSNQSTEREQEKGDIEEAVQAEREAQQRNSAKALSALRALYEGERVKNELTAFS